MHRRATAAPLLAAVAALAVVLAGCGSQDGLALARQACGNVTTSIRLYDQSEHATTLASALSLRQQAYNQLRRALPVAAAANSDNGHWNALMTDISETARVDEGNLISSLQAVCKEADGPQGDQAQPLAPGSGSNSGGTVGSLPSSGGGGSSGSGSNSGGGGSSGSGSGGTVGSLPPSGATTTTGAASPSTLPGQGG